MGDQEPSDYVERVYAGVLGKMIGVYMGRPIEGWTYEDIMTRLGEVDTYVHQRLGVPLVVTDDDLSGTFTFIRAFEDYGFPQGVTSEQIGQTWLNYLVENKTILWWGGRGKSTEHTAYLNLKAGIPAPRSGSVAQNGSTTANQIGAMIFIDGWAMVCPGDPDRAAALAREAARVSHDDEAVHAAVVIAAMESLAFVESDLGTLVQAGLDRIPPTSLVASQIREVLNLYRQEPDWKSARAWLDQNHGYRFYPGNCHVIPNFSLILLALLYGEGDFRRSMMIVNTSGWDTDCNAANLGCLLGIRNGLAALEACPDLRFPPRDLLYLSSADGGRGISDAAAEALRLVNIHRALVGVPPLSPKGGARFHFALPGSVHGFAPVATGASSQSVRLSNSGQLDIDFEAPRLPCLVAAPVFIPPGTPVQPTYDFLASPGIYPGQTLEYRCRVPQDCSQWITVRPFVTAYSAYDQPVRHYGPGVRLGPGSPEVQAAWRLEIGLDGPIFEVGLELASGSDRTARVSLDWMGWSGVPQVTFRRHYPGTVQWKAAWVHAMDHWWTQFPESFHLGQNRGTGLIIQGTRDWKDYHAEAAVAGYGAVRWGVAARVQGLRRYYAVLLTRQGTCQLVKELDGTTVVAEWSFAGKETEFYTLGLSVHGRDLTVWVDGQVAYRWHDGSRPLEGGAVSLVLEEGSMICDGVSVGPVPSDKGGES